MDQTVPIEGDSVGDSLFDAAIAAWFDAVKSDVVRDREEFLGRYPEIHSQLRRVFANYDCVQEPADTLVGGP